MASEFPPEWLEEQLDLKDLRGGGGLATNDDRSVEDVLAEIDEGEEWPCPKGCGRILDSPEQLEEHDRRWHEPEDEERRRRAAEEPKPTPVTPVVVAPPVLERSSTEQDEPSDSGVSDEVEEPEPDPEQWTEEVATMGTRQYACRKCGRSFGSSRGERDRHEADCTAKPAGRKTAGRRKRVPAVRTSKEPSLRPRGKSRRGDRNGDRRQVEAAVMLDGARAEAKVICRYLAEEAGWTLGPGHEIDVFMAVAHAKRVAGREE